MQPFHKIELEKMSEIFSKSHRPLLTQNICETQKSKHYKEIYHFVKKVVKNETGVRDIPDLLVCTPPKAGTTNWSKVLWQLKYLNKLGILVDGEDKKYINYTNLYSLRVQKYFYTNSDTAVLGSLVTPRIDTNMDHGGYMKN